MTGKPPYFQLNSASPAIDAGNNSICAAPPVNNTSQNGLTRPQGLNCDIGSYEAPQTRVPLIFVPGTAATELDEHGKELWLNMGELLNPIEIADGDPFLNPLQFNGSATPIEKNVYAARLILSKPGNDVYQTFVKYLTTDMKNDFPGQASYVLGQVGDPTGAKIPNNDRVINYDSRQNFWLLPTDFRNDLSGQAVRLGVLVNDVLKYTGATQVDLVAHSQGGLIVRQYFLNNPNNAAKVHQLITIGTPYLGTPRVFQALRYGWNFGIVDETIPILVGSVTVSVPLLNPLEAKKLAQNWPGAYEQLPANDAYFKTMREYFCTDRDLNFDGKPDGCYNSLAAMDSLLEHRIPDQGSKYDQYNAALVQEAEQFQRDGIRKWQAPQEFNRTLIAGSGKCTPSIYHEFMSDGKVVYDISQDNGDDTILVNSADMNYQTTDDVSYASPDPTSKVHVYFANAFKIGGHTALPNGLAKDVATLLISNNPANKPPDLFTTKKPASCVQFNLSAGANLQVTDSSGNTMGAVPNSQGSQNGIPNSDFYLFPNNQIAVLPSGGPYTVSINGTGTGTFDLKFARMARWHN